MKNKYIEELKKVNREGIEELLAYMDGAGFFEAPCSGAHHLAKEGGLVEHSLNVLDIARRLNEAWEAGIDDETIIIVSLLHDLGKAGDYGKPNYVENILKSGKRSDSKPYVTNTELLYLPHEIRSVKLAARFIELSEDEEIAIYWHNGLYSTFKYDIPGKETPLYMILHFADLWCSRVVETENEDEGQDDM